MPPPRPPLTGAALQQNVRQHYPHPIAAAYRAVREQRTPQALPLVHLADSVLHYLAAVAASAYLRTNRDHPAANQQIAQLLLSPTWSSGNVLGMCREALRGVQAAGVALPYPELLDFFFQPDDTKQTGHDRLDHIVGLRNDLVHRAAPVEQQLLDALDAVLARMPWLARERLVRPVEIDDATVRVVDLLHGDLPTVNEPLAFGIDRGDLGHELAPVRADRDSLLVVRRDGREYLPLYPLSRFLLGPDATYFFQGGRWQAENRLQRASFVSFSAGRERSEEAGEHVCRCLEHHVQQLAERLRPEQRGAVSPTVVAAPPGDPDHTLTSVHEEQQLHLRTFVGREALLERLRAWIDGPSPHPQPLSPEGRGVQAGRYLLLLGAPGQGKSAMMAKLAEREAERGGCLLHMVKSHAQPRRFLPALLSQAAREAHTTFGADAYTGDIDDLREALVRGLKAVVQRCGRAVVVLDALDELGEEGRRATFLPTALPEGVRVVLTCRPDIPLVQTLRARLGAHLDEQALEPFTLDDFRQLLEQRLEPTVREAVQAQVGLAELFARVGPAPLFLTHFLNDTAARWQAAAATGKPFRLELGRVPASLEAVFDQVHDHIREARDGQPTARGRQREELLHVLCLAREPLTVEQLSELAAVSGQALRLGECRDRVREMSQYLLDMGGGRYKPWHQGLADHVRGQVLGAAGVRQVEAVFAVWLAAVPGSGYALRHRIRHLLAAGRASEATTLLMDLPQLEVRVEAGLVFELAGDFTATVQALPEGVERRRLGLLEEALRRDIHFIHRHSQDYPQGLFQCLWNNAWWYDCPDAARHYVEGRSPGQNEGVGLHQLLNQWRTRKAGVVWLRSLRPPFMHLNTVQRMVLCGHAEGVTSVVWSPDGTRLASASEDTVRVWDAVSGSELLCLREHRDYVCTVQWSADSRYLAGASSDRTVRVWDASTGNQLLCLEGHKSGVSSVAWSPDCRCLASGSADGTVRVWDAGTGDQLLCLEGHEYEVLCVYWSPDSTRLASASKAESRIWDVGSGTLLVGWGLYARGGYSMAWSPDGRSLAEGFPDGSVRMWDASTGVQVFSLSGYQSRVWSVCWSPDGSRLASGSADGTVSVWDTTAAVRVLCLRGHEHGVWSVCWSPDGSQLASGSRDGTVRVWDVVSEAESFRLHGHEDWVNSMTCSRDGTRITSISYEAVRVWDAQFGECIEVLRDVEDPYAGANSTAAVSKKIVPGRLETSIQDVASGRVIAWLPHILWRSCVPSSRTLAGAYGSHVYLFTLEGEPPGVSGMS